MPARPARRRTRRPAKPPPRSDQSFRSGRQAQRAPGLRADDAVHFYLRVSLPADNGVACQRTIHVVWVQARVVVLIQRELDVPHVVTAHHRRLEHQEAWLVRRGLAWLGRVGRATEVDDLRGVDDDQHRVVTPIDGRRPAVAVDAAFAPETVHVAGPAVAADGEQRAVLVHGSDLGVVGCAVTVPVEEHDVAGLRLPAVAGRVLRIAIVDGVGAVGEASPAARLHRREGNLGTLVDVGDEVAAPRLYGTP